MALMSLANPLGLLALGAIAVLIALHLLTRRRQVVPVASLLIWRQIAAQPLERRRFRPDLLFWLRLVILLALAAALARPLVPTALDAEPAPLIAVLDVSASMQTRERDGTRLALARARLAEQLDALAPGAPVMLMAASDRARVVTTWTTDHAVARRALDQLDALDTPTRLGPALDLALGEAAARAHTRVVVATDQPHARDGVQWLHVGETDDNVAVAGLTVERAPFAGVRDASALVRSYAAEPRTVDVTASVDGRPFAVQRVELAARASATVRLGTPPAAGVLGVSLRAGDALAVDDRAWALLPPAAPPAVTVVGDEPALVHLLTAALGTAPRVLARNRLEGAAPAGVLVVAGSVPPVLPPHRGLLLVDPPPDDPLCAGGAVVAGAAVVDWSDGHPLLAGIDGLEALEVAAARPLAVPGWGDAIVEAAAGTDAFPLLVAGTRAGVRTACLGVGLDASLVTSDRVPLVVLVLATLRWLGEGDAGGIALVTGRPETTAAAIEPASSLLTAATAVLATHVGVHEVRSNGVPTVVVANLFDDAESDVGRTNAHDSGSPAAPTPTARQGRDVTRWCLLAALVMAVVEWLVWARRGETS